MNKKELQRTINRTYKSVRYIVSKLNGKKMNLTDATIELSELLGNTLYVMNEMLNEMGDE